MRRVPAGQVSFPLYPHKLIAVENWFSRLERREVQRKAFQSVKELRESLKRFILTCNKNSAKPFVWTKDAQKVLTAEEKVKQQAANQTPKIIL